MKWRENPVTKALAFVTAVAAFAAAAIMGWYQIVNFDVLWGDQLGYAAGPGDGYTVSYLKRQDLSDIRELLELYHAQADGTLGSWQVRQLAEYEARFDPSGTNLRWQLLDEDGGVLYGNTQDPVPDQAEGLSLYTYTWKELQAWEVTLATGMDWESALPMADNYDGSTWTSTARSDTWEEELELAVETAREEDAAGVAQDGTEVTVPDRNTVYLDAYGAGDVLLIQDGNGLTWVYGPTVNACLAPNEFGWQYVVGTGWVQVSAAQALDLALWLDGSVAGGGGQVDDAYAQAYRTLADWKADRGLYLAFTLAALLAGVLLTVYLCAGAGHKKGREGVYLNWFHRIPGDVLLVLLFLAAVALVAGAAELLNGGYLPMAGQLLGVGALVAAAAALLIGGLVTLCARCKARTVLRNTLIWQLCRALYRGARALSRALPLMWKAVLAVLVYVIFSLLTQRATFAWLLGTLLCGAYLCLWACQWKRIRLGTREIVKGNVDYHIDSARMLPDLRGHADELNSLGQSISAAVDERMRSEHFKAELITNVSHDLKTPLTSIINYVDLLKKADIQDPRAAEYIEVLERKSQRLKKLTEDLVEASKASTGSLAVSLERIDLAQLADQALAEHLERLEERRLTVVRSIPEEPVWVEADGRHLWRVLDNLLSNCAKYALEGTRVYVAVQGFADCAVLSVKNISRDELNVPPERLMERFVRGDESRTAEGSGLGLSIAQSLTELQGGRFQIDIDGDLFKATVTLPAAP